MATEALFLERGQLEATVVALQADARTREAASHVVRSGPGGVY